MTIQQQFLTQEEHFKAHHLKKGVVINREYCHICNPPEATPNQHFLNCYQLFQFAFQPLLPYNQVVLDNFNITELYRERIVNQGEIQKGDKKIITVYKRLVLLFAFRRSSRTHENDLAYFLAVFAFYTQGFVHAASSTLIEKVTSGKNPAERTRPLYNIIYQLQQKWIGINNNQETTSGK